jgi:hypothetical protein
VKSTTQLRSAPRLRMSGAIPLCPILAFLMYTGTTSCFILCSQNAHDLSIVCSFGSTSPKDLQHLTKHRSFQKSGQVDRGHPVLGQKVGGH